MTVVTNYIDQAAYDFVTGQHLPELRTGVLAPNGDASPFKDLAVGSQYVQASAANPTWARVFQKFRNDQRDDDWLMGVHVLTQRVVLADFTDGGSTSGTLDLTETIPVGAFVLRAVLRNVTGFAGDTSAVMVIGDGTDADRYNASTPSVFTTANAIDMGAPSGTQIHTAAATVRLTVTSNSDFGAISAGAATVCIYMLA